MNPLLLGPQPNDKNAFTRKARLLQSHYRADVLKEHYTVGPNANSGTPWGNYLYRGAHTGKNFILPETFEYAKDRILHKHKDEVISAYRMFHNMMSSQPLAFNLFHPLKLILERDPTAAAQMLRDAFPWFGIDAVQDIGIEVAPTPKEDYTNDKSAFDATAVFSAGTRRCFVAIEVKYTESLGANKAKSDQKVLLAKEHLTDAGLHLYADGFPQLYRNFLLAAAYAKKHAFDDFYLIVLAPEENDSSVEEINTMRSYLKSESREKVRLVLMEQFVAALDRACPDDYILKWLQPFRERYLAFDAVKPLIPR